ncbi:MAG TPA: glucokinase [Ruminococcaceae bacterium]|nr:glucokinase [Oscillospiraceae bacterium]
MYYLGVDLGGTNIAAGVVDENYRIIARANRKTHVPCTPDEICCQIAGTVFDAIENAGETVDSFKYIGIGTPGAVNRDTGIVEYANNLHFTNLELQKLLKERVRKDVIIENDANAAAYGEYKAGVLKGATNALAITLGTGIGSGIIINGAIYAGTNFSAGEMGHMVIAAGGRECTCGRKGCWEAYASATGLINMTKEEMAKTDKNSEMWRTAGSLDNVDGRTAFDAMRKGDAAAKKVVDGYIYYLACGIINCINILEPDKLCIGGGISNEGESLLAPLREYVARENYAKNSKKQTVICKASLGNDAGIIGAALLGE